MICWKLFKDQYERQYVVTAHKTGSFEKLKKKIVEITNGMVSEDVKSISDVGLMVEADKIFKQQEMCSANVSAEITENLKKRFSEILKELNSRGMYHVTQKLDNSMSGYVAGEKHDKI